jgi:hypothetical protein
MSRAIGRLLVVFLAFAAATCIIALFPPLITYKWEVARAGVRDISRRVTDACTMLDKREFSVDAINDWLAGELSPDHPLATELRESPHKDPWKNPYRCIRFVHTYGDETRALGIYSMGRDGVSKTNGNDLDDLNSWNWESHQWYVRDINTRRRWELLMKGVLLTPIVYFGVIGISWIITLPLKRRRTKR